MAYTPIINYPIPINRGGTGVTTLAALKALLGLVATTVEVDVGTPCWQGRFTITDSDIAATSVVLVWQAPGPYTGKGTLADEAAMQPVNVVSVQPGSGSAVVRWETPPMLAMVPGVPGNRLRNLTSVNNDLYRTPTYTPTRIGKVRGNIKFSYVVF